MYYFYQFLVFNLMTEMRGKESPEYWENTIYLSTENPKVSRALK